MTTLVFGALAFATILAGCGGPTTSTTSLPASSGAVAVGSPAASVPPSVGGSPSGSGTPGSSGAAPSSERWPGPTALAMIALGSFDNEIQKAGADLQKAAADQDLEAMWGAADGLAKLVDAQTSNVGALEAYPATAPVAGLYRQAFADLGGGAKQLRDAIRKGDATGIVAGTRQIVKGLETYGTLRQQIGPLVAEAIRQQRLLVK